MSKISIFCIVTACNRAEQIVDYLRTANFSNKDLSVLLLDQSSAGESEPARDTPLRKDGLGGETPAGVRGGAFGWVDGMKNFAIPGVGPFIAAGPIIEALGSIATSASVDGIAGSLVGLGVPEFESRQYESRIKSGNILLAVHTEAPEDIARAKSIFAQNYGENTCVIGAVSAKKRPAMEHAPVPTAFIGFSRP